jgi:hypothetical protein
MLTRTLDFTTEDGSFDMGKVANMGMGAAAASEVANIMGPWALAFLPEMMVGGALLGGALTEKQQTFTDTKLQDAIKSLGDEV